MNYRERVEAVVGLVLREFKTRRKNQKTRRWGSEPPPTLTKTKPRRKKSNRRWGSEPPFTEIYNYFQSHKQFSDVSLNQNIFDTDDK